MNISELSKLSGLTAPTIRYYEQIKLLGKAKRKANGYREYSQSDLQQLFLIKQAQQVGFSLSEIKKLLPTDIIGWQHDQLVEILSAKVKELEEIELKVAQNKKNLLELLAAMQNKPEQISCEENAQRLLSPLYQNT